MDLTPREPQKAPEPAPNNKPALRPVDIEKARQALLRAGVLK
jgi:hypothetical protein